MRSRGASKAVEPGRCLLEDHAAVVTWVRGEAKPGDTVLLMGARDPDLPALARAVFAALE